MNKNEFTLIKLTKREMNFYNVEEVKLHAYWGSIDLLKEKI